MPPQECEQTHGSALCLDVPGFSLEKSEDECNTQVILKSEVYPFFSRANELLVMEWLCCCPCLAVHPKILCWTWCPLWDAMETLQMRRWREILKGDALFNVPQHLPMGRLYYLTLHRSVLQQRKYHIWETAIFFFNCHDEIDYLFLMKWPILLFFKLCVHTVAEQPWPCNLWALLALVEGGKCPP